MRVYAGPSGAKLQPVPLFETKEWAADDHAAAFHAFQRTSKRIVNADQPLREGRPARANLIRACRAALALESKDAQSARAFFEQHFHALRIVPPTGDGFLTGYYQPEIDASLTKTPDFPTPVLSRPSDLMRVAPFPDRAAIETGALDGRGLECVWLPDPVELFFAQVQGSARLKLSDGMRMRLTYAGRNGHPYSSIGKIVVSEGHIPLAAMSLERLKGWLKANPDHARRIMRMNASYVFFSLEPETDPREGPIGAAGTPLLPLRSIAVDRTLWSYGLPFFVSADLPTATGTMERFESLTVAQDTGTAIVGPARIDLYFGAGAEAGTRAGLLRHPGDLTVLLPRPVPSRRKA